VRSTSPRTFAAALASCKREAINSFGDDAVLIEKYVQRPRHIEIQVFGDTQGNYVHLFERDCSVQRRHQKVLEEAPAPGMTAEMRAQMGAGSRRRRARCATTWVPARWSSSSSSARTAAMNFFFMEMNTRLQVEHPVTEAITGQDLVEWQLRVASPGKPLPLATGRTAHPRSRDRGAYLRRNPDNNFLPATGTLHVYRKPEHAPRFERLTTPCPGGRRRARRRHDLAVLRLHGGQAHRARR
jgi:3-methylcrotonyl-CoA carboxylase alpha subunit